MAFDINRIEEKIDKVVTGGIELDDEGSGIAIRRLVDAMEVAKLMSISGPAIPSFMRGNPGICYAAVVRAVRWGMDPFFVAEQMYPVNNARAPLQKKLWPVYTGEGDSLKCTVYGLPKGQTEPLDYETPTLKKLIEIKGRNDGGYVKGSPLYDNDAKQQLWYYGARGFCRRHFPEVLAGIYDRDEFEPVEPKDVTPERETLAQRLKGQRRIASRRGFDHDHVGEQLSKPAEHSDPAAPATDGAEPVPQPAQETAT